MTMRVLSALLVGACTIGAAGAEETVAFSRFGPVTLYATTPKPAHVVLFVSGDGGWNQGVVDMARQLASLDALVAGIDINHYLRELEASTEPCVYPAADFEALSQFLQKKLGFPTYQAPVLVGYSSGATLVYAALAQAPPTTFRGAISLGFCPDLRLSHPLCSGRGLASRPKPGGKRGVDLVASGSLASPWVVLQGTVDQVCPARTTQAFVTGVPGAEIVVLPKVGHGFAVQRNWMSQFRQAFHKLVAAPEPGAYTAGKPASSPGESAAPDGVPVVELPALHPDGDELAVILSGDGGWASLDRQVGETLAAKGVPVVGIDSLRYFWTPRTPDDASRDLARVASHYLAAWHRSSLWLIGYSRGADVLPFMIDRLPQDLRKQVRLVALLAPGLKTDFEFHVADWLGGSGGTFALQPEMEKLAGMRVLCFYGSKEKDSLCPRLPPSLAEPVVLEGAHHFGGAYPEIAARILAAGGRD